MIRSWKKAGRILVPENNIVPHMAQAVRPPSGKYAYYKMVVNSVRGQTQTGVGEFLLKTTPSGSDLLLGATGTASSTNAGSSPANAFDGVLTTNWISAVGDTIGAWLKGALPAPVTPGYVGLGMNTGVRIPSSFTIQVSKDNINWITLGTKEIPIGDGSSSIVAYFPIVGEGWRLYINTLQGGTGFNASVAEWTVNSISGGANLLTGGLIYGSRWLNGFTPDKVQDGSLATYWAGPTPTDGFMYLGYGYPVGVKKGTPVSITISSGSGPSLFAAAPKTFTLQSTLDGGVTWTNVQSWTAATWASGTQTQTFII